MIDNTDDTELIQSILGGERAPTVQFYIESNVKNGLQFSASSYFTDISAGQELDTIVITGDKPVIIKAQYVAIKDSGDIQADWYESPTYTGGTDITPFIYNQTTIAPQAATVQLLGIIPTDSDAGDYTPNVASAPNVTDVGTKILPTVVTLGTVTQATSGSSARNSLIGLDHILKPNTTYLFRRKCISATESLFGYSTWYEGTPDLPRKQTP